MQSKQISTFSKSMSDEFTLPLMVPGAFIVTVMRLPRQLRSMMASKTRGSTTSVPFVVSCSRVKTDLNFFIRI